MIAYPVVADDEAYEINRFQFTNTSLPGTTLTLGRQRILLDDQRFIGNSGWRQNEQTFDAFRMVNRTVTNLVLDATYLNRVNRVNGPDSPQGVYKGDGILLNAGYQTKIGKLSAFGYLLDFDPITNIPAGINPIRDSTSTYGLRFAGDKPVGKIKLAYAASYATQTDYGDNPLDFDLDYLFGELTATFRQFGLGVGTEIMEGNGLPGAAGKGFTTPLGTLHKFQGWADKFLTTPPNGLEDLYANASVNLKGVGVLDTLAFIVSYHDYDAEARPGRLRQRVGRLHRRQTQAFQPDAQVRGLPAGRARCRRAPPASCGRSSNSSGNQVPGRETVITHGVFPVSRPGTIKGRRS